VGRYEEHIRAERAKANVWNGIVKTPEMEGERDALMGSAKDEERRWAREGDMLAVWEDIEY
jgi:hypothetical protein